jgi:hypothetical protein
MISFFFLCFVGVTHLGDEVTDVEVAKGDVPDGLTLNSLGDSGSEVAIHERSRQGCSHYCWAPVCWFYEEIVRRG